MLVNNRNNRRKKKECKKRKPRVVLVVGTCYLNLIQFPELFANSMVILIDVPEELLRYKVHKQNGIRIHRLAIGNNKTIKDLIREYGNEAQVAAFDGFPNAASKDGLGQTRGIGDCAIRELLDQPEVKELLGKAESELMGKGGGVIQNAGVLVLAGTGGGVASSAARVVLMEIVDGLLAAGVVSVHVDVHLVGALSFHDIDSERTAKNSACAILDWARLAKGKAGLDVTMFCYELPLVGRDRITRDRLIRGQYSAMLSEGIEKSVNQERSNHSTKGPFGNFYMPRMTFFRDVPAAERASNVAQAYQQHIGVMLAVDEDERLIDDVEFASRKDPFADTDPIDLAELFDDTLDDDEVADWLLGRIHDSLHKSDLRGQLRLRDDKVLPLQRVSALLDSDTADPTMLQERLIMARTLLRRLDREIGQRLEHGEQFASFIAKWQARTVQALRKLSIISDQQTRSSRNAIATIDDYVTYAVEYFASEVEIEQLAATEAVVRRFDEIVTSRLERIQDEMLDCHEFDERSIGDASVEAQPFDDVLKQIFEVTENPSDDAFLISDVLARCAGRVTQLGLSRLVNSLDATTESIAAAVVDAVNFDGEDIVKQSPPWGGHERAGNVEKFIVYPPVDNDLREGLIKAHQKRNDPHVVTFAPMGAPSRTIVITEFWSCRVLTDLLTPYYRKALLNAANDTLSPMYVIDPSVLSEFSIDFQTPPCN